MGVSYLLNYDFVYRSDMGALTNSPRYSILYSIGCWTNAMDYDSIAERFIRNPDGGGIAFIGNSRYGWYEPGLPGEGPSDLYDKEFFNATFTNNIYHIGEAVAYSKIKYIPDSREDGDAMRWLQYAINLLGDPELPIWTDTPKTFMIDKPSAIPARSQMITIDVSENGEPVRNAVVCIQKTDNGIYNVTLTNASGKAEFSIDPDIGLLNVTITKHNFMVYESTLSIVPCGDVDCNGVVNITDVRLLLNYIFNPAGYAIIESIGDVDGSGTVNILDARLLLNHVSDPGKYPLGLW